MQLNFDIQADSSALDEINFSQLENEFDVQIMMQKRTTISAVGQSGKLQTFHIWVRW